MLDLDEIGMFIMLLCVGITVLAFTYIVVVYAIRWGVFTFA